MWIKLTDRNHGPIYINFSLVTDFMRYPGDGHTTVFLNSNSEGKVRVIHVNETPDEIFSSFGKL